MGGRGGRMCRAGDGCLSGRGRVSGSSSLSADGIADRCRRQEDAPRLYGPRWARGDPGSSTDRPFDAMAAGTGGRVAIRAGVLVRPRRFRMERTGTIAADERADRLRAALVTGAG